MNEAIEPNVFDIRTEISELYEILKNENAEALLTFFEKLHVADIADIIEQSDPEKREQIIGLWGKNIDASVLTELEVGVREEIIEYIPHGVLIRALRELESDDLVYIIEDLDENRREAILLSLDHADRAAVTQSLTYPEASAGRLMRREYVVAPEHWNVGQTIDFMRASDSLPDFFHNVFIVNPKMRPIGAVRLSRIMAAPRSEKLINLADEGLQTFHTLTEQEEVAYAFNQYAMLSAPVLDDQGRIIGVLDVEDAIEILDDEAEEDILRLAGVGDEELTDRVWETARLRFPWLAINLMTSILAAFVISRFSDAIDAIVALAILMPIVASMGGNAGTQTLTVAVRAIATKDLTNTNAFRIVRRELFVGLMNGLAFAIIIGLIGYLWFGNFHLGLVLASAMIVNLTVAGLAGILVPITLEKLGADPALASGSFVTTVTDVVGFFVFLGLATLVLL